MFVPVVVDKNMACARQSLGDPKGVMREEQLLGDLGSTLVGARVAPPVYQVAAHAAVPACAAGSLRRSSAVVYNPNLAEVARRDENLVERCVVIYRVDMRMMMWIFDECIGGISQFAQTMVQIDSFRMVGDYPIVALAGIVILNQMIPHTPLPDYCSAACSCGFDFNHLVNFQPLLP